jgi:hypothetical protein
MSICCLKHSPAALGALCLLAATGLPAFAAVIDGPGPGPRDSNGPGCNVFPASANIGTRVPLSYFGPPPSETNPSLVGPPRSASNITRPDVAIQLRSRIARLPARKSVQMKRCVHRQNREWYPSYIRMGPPLPLRVFIHWPTGELAWPAEILVVPQSQKYSVDGFGRRSPYAFLSDFRFWHIAESLAAARQVSLRGYCRR